jgi:succinate dehydrogenase/fumarate reductase flavoprotein subunit
MWLPCEAMLGEQRSMRLMRVYEVTANDAIDALNEELQDKGGTMNKDVVIVGAGGAGLMAAVVCAKLGLEVLVVEKTPYLGGTTALSGGGIWVPANELARKAGYPDSIDAARRYLHATIGPSIDSTVLESFLASAPEMLDWVEANTQVHFEVIPGFPDWAPDVEGASEAGRMLSPLTYDGRLLGAHFAELRVPLASFNAPGGFMIGLGDMPHLPNVTKSWASFRHMAKLVARFAYDRLRYPRGTRLTMGNALAARLLRSALDAGVELWRNTPALSLRAEGGRIAGVVVEHDGKRIDIAVRRGVVLASGGFSANAQMRARYIPYAEHHVSLTAEGNTGDGLAMALKAGAIMETENRQNASWVVMSLARKPDGSIEKFPHLFLDRGKPGCMAVNAAGKRFSNEAGMDMVEHMHASGSVPAHLICDHRCIRKYGLGLVKPGGLGLKKWQRAGYITSAATLDELAALIGVDPAGLAATAAANNEYARTGIDPEFGKGAKRGDFALGDPAHQPNPCLGPIGEPPFYAVKIQPGDGTTTLGLRVDGLARVLDAAGKPIPGLHAVGLDMNSLWRGIAPGNGSNNGLSLTFGYLAGKTLAAGQSMEAESAADRGAAGADAGTVAAATGATAAGTIAAAAGASAAVTGTNAAAMGAMVRP